MVRASALIVIAGFVAGCHDDACVWSVSRTSQAATAAVARDATMLASSIEFAGATSSRSLATDARSTRIGLTIAIANDPDVDHAVLDLALGDPDVVTAPRVIDLAMLDATMRLVQGSTVVTEEPPRGTLTLDELAVPCELSDRDGDNGPSWACGTDIVMELDAAAGSYRVTATLSQREQLVEACHACDGIEGCDY